MQLNNKSQAGNVFVIILGGVFLFGALMFTFSRSGSKGSGNLTKQQTKIIAQEIISYANMVESAVNRVRRNGCSENEINFDNAVVAGYSNTGAPIDGSCDIFSATGGKIDYTAPDPAAFDSGSSANFSFGEHFFTGGNVAPEMEDPARNELLYMINFLKRDVCVEINNNVNVDNPSNNPPDEATGICAAAGHKFTGAYGSGACGIDAIAPLLGKFSACIETLADGNESYTFYHVLLAR